LLRYSHLQQRAMLILKLPVITPPTPSRTPIPQKLPVALFVNMQIKDTIKVGDSVLLKFTVHNPADSTQQFCKWHTPFEPLISKYLEVKNEAGTEADYRGAMAKRIMPPPASSYIKVNPKDSLTSKVDLLKGFAITQPGKYTITYTGQNMSGLVSEQTVSFVYLKK